MYQKILVPVDGSPTSHRGLEEAIRLARLTGGRLRLIHVIDELSFGLSMDAYSGHPGDWLAALREEGKAVLDACAATAVAQGISSDSVLRDNFSSAVHEQVNLEATQWQADLIVLGTHGRRGVGRFVLGSSAENIVRHAVVPVLLVRAPEAPRATAATAEISTGSKVSAKLPSAALKFE